MAETRAVLFDLDGTLCQYQNSSEVLLVRAFETLELGPFFTVGDYYAKIGDFVSESRSKSELRRSCFEALAEEHGYERSIGTELANVYASNRDHTEVEFVPGAEQVLESLTREYPVGIVTDGEPKMQKTKLRALELTDAISVIVYAGHDTEYKPHSEPFEFALNELGIIAERAIFVGDSYESDIVGANQAGLTTVWLCDEESQVSDTEADYCIQSLDELVSII